MNLDKIKGGITMGILNNKIAIVTGASSGVGYGVAKALAKEGASVCVCARRLEKLETLVQEIKALGGKALAVACDVTDLNQIKNVVNQCVQSFGGVDILANLAQGAMKPFRIEDISEEYALLAYRSGPLASMFFMQECLPYLKKSGHGRIINTASAAGYDGSAQFGAYGMAKEAIRAITRTAANEWGQFGITSNVFLPLIATDNFRETEPQALAHLESISPLKRIGTVEADCGDILTFIASDKADYLNGQSFMLDGGIHMHS